VNWTGGAVITEEEPMTDLMELELAIARVVELIETWGVVETATVWTAVEAVEIFGVFGTVVEVVEMLGVVEVVWPVGLVELVVEVVEVVVITVLVAGVVRLKVVVVEDGVEGAAEVVNGSGSEGQYGCNVWYTTAVAN
jgi:hypothetical protein